MKPGMPNNIENKAIHRIDAERERASGEFRGQGKPAEKFVALFFNGIPGFKARQATENEDKGEKIGGHQIVDVVVSFTETDKPAFAIQITSSDRRWVRDKKIGEMYKSPFIKLEEMGKGEVFIPKVLMFLDAAQIKNFFENPDLAKHPELSMKVLDDILRSLAFDLAQTQISLEKEAVKKLIDIFELERKKYLH